MQPQVTKTEFTCKLITIRSKRSFAEVTSALEVRPPVRQPSGRVRPNASVRQRFVGGAASWPTASRPRSGCSGASLTPTALGAIADSA